jgi:DNA-directed RNA polymerase specialized sigma24 family protein
MSGSNDGTDDRDDAASAGSSGGQRDVEGLAREWARRAERDQSDRLFEALVLAAQAELLRSVRAMAGRLVGPDEADDVINSVWARLWANQRALGTPAQTERDVGVAEPAMTAGHVSAGQPGRFDPARGSFTAYFYRAVWNACIDNRRRRRALPLPGPDVTAGDLLPDVANLEEEALARLDRLEEKLVAAVEVLPLSDKQRGMLGLMLDTDQAHATAGGGASVAQRQAKRRLRREVDNLADLSAEERRAASLVRTHHTVAAAAAAAERSVDVPGLYASATRKVFALFGLAERA